MASLVDCYKSDIVPEQSTPQLTESLSHIAWATNSSTIFAATAWDGSMRIYEIVPGPYGNTNMNIVQRFEHKFQYPALKCVWLPENNQVLVGLADGTVKGVDVSTAAVIDVASHGSPISSVHILPGQNTVITTGYDANVFFWQAGNPSPMFHLNIENKIFNTDFQYPLLVAGMSNQRMAIVDINFMNNKNIIEPNDFLNKYSQIQTIAINHKCTTFGIGSIDGRANISSINKGPNASVAPRSIITFKSNKSEEQGNTIMYPINSCGFNPVKEKWFMTAGSDGAMHFWDFDARNKIKTLNFGGNPITVAKVSPAGDKIAYGLGNDWHIGQEGTKWAPKLGVHILTEQETRFPGR